MKLGVEVGRVCPQRAAEWCQVRCRAPLTDCRPKLGRTAKFRSADFQSAVSRISNPPTVRSVWHAICWVRPADYKSAIQQIENLRYLGSGCTGLGTDTPCLSGSWEENVGLIRPRLVEHAGIVSGNAPADQPHKCNGFESPCLAAKPAYFPTFW